MPLENGSHNELADVVNPWAARSEVSFSSAVKVKEPRPGVRRRGSDGTARRSRNDHEPNHVGHSRARTMDDDVASPASSHPLASPSSSRSLRGFVTGLLSAHDTRPHMKRVLSDAEAPSRSGNGRTDASCDNAGESVPKEGERVVIMHEVMSNDSLNAVALKYGVSLTDLRRWNQLWPSDPIHLRKALYIPLDKARHAKHFQTTFMDSDESAKTLNSHSSTSHDNVGGASDNAPNEDDQREPLTVVRVPASQMSFFPPPSTPLSSRSVPETVNSQTIFHHTGPHSSRPTLPSSFMESPASFPASSSPSSAPVTSLCQEYACRTPFSRLDKRNDIDTERRPGLGTRDPRSESYARTRGARGGGGLAATEDALELDPLFGISSDGGRMRRKSEDFVVQSTVPVGGAEPQRSATRYDSPVRARTSPTVRTAQLEPSPVMQLPPIRRKTKPPGG